MASLETPVTWGSVHSKTEDNGHYEKKGRYTSSENQRL